MQVEETTEPIRFLITITKQHYFLNRRSNKKNQHFLRLKWNRNCWLDYANIRMTVEVLLFREQNTVAKFIPWAADYNRGLLFLIWARYLFLSGLRSRVVRQTTSRALNVVMWLTWTSETKKGPLLPSVPRSLSLSLSPNGWSRVSSQAFWLVKSLVENIQNNKQC